MLLLEFLPNWFFLTLFAIVCSVNSLLLIILPETVGKSMVETIDEIENKKEKQSLKDN